jgi:hypothetical protein
LGLANSQSLSQNKMPFFAFFAFFCLFQQKVPFSAFYEPFLPFSIFETQFHWVLKIFKYYFGFS